MGAPHNSADSPVMRQYLEIKSRYPDAILMFRMGDFYELFFEDAVTVAPILDIAVTTRDKNVDDPVPMAGVPYHAIGGYLRTLVERGFKVAICEQMETPEQARKRKGPKIVKREVVRVATPGALIDEEHLRGTEPNYLLGMWPDGEGGYGLAALDISAGDFQVSHAPDAVVARTELHRVGPREVLAPESCRGFLEEVFGPDAPRLEPREDMAAAAVVKRVGVLADESGVSPLRASVQEAAAQALTYAEATQPGQTLLLHRMRRHDPGVHLVLDDTSIRNLEIFQTLRDGERRGSLLWAVDGTKTAMGGRTLRAWLGAPARDVETIGDRHDAVEALIHQPAVRERIQSRLKDVRDVMRLAARARLGTINPRELAALRRSVQALPDLVACLGEVSSGRTDGTLPRLLALGGDLLEDVRAELERVLVDDPPAIVREGGFVRDGADADLDAQRTLRNGGREALAAIETREREAHNIPSLKVLHNRVFGYFIEVPKSHLAKVPKHYVRKQTIANAERYVTEELAGHESAVLGAQSRALARELEMFAALRGLVSEAGERLCAVGEALARLDVLAGFAQVAERHHFVRPEMVEEPLLEITEGRHPVVERMLGTGRFVPNDVRLRARGSGATEADARLWLVTGPNMGGKSTVMRQVALAVILAHAGCFVPATSARIGLVDRVFTRVGAADDLGRGESTFMVEMREAAQILGQASERSLVLLDEIGRGTATFDGLALAWAITEFLHDQVGCRAMFATHYHELCALETRLPGIRNVHVTVHEERGKIVFLHRIAAGAAGRSYGIQVGRLAGLPRRVLRRASKILERLEAQEASGPRDQLDLFGGAPSSEPEPESDDVAAVEDVLDELRGLDPDDLSPRQAHEVLRTVVDRLNES